MSKPDAPKYKAFPAMVCQRIRNLQAHISAAQVQRGKAFKSRDHLKAQIADLEGGDPQIEHLKAQRNDIIDRIDSLNIAIKWGQDELKQTIEDADTPGLFDSADLSLPDFDSELLERAKKQAKKEDDGDGEGEGDGDDAGEDPKQLQLVGGPAEPLGNPPAEPEGDDAVIASMVPGRFRDASAREYQIGDMAALQELVSNECGSAWFWRPRVSKQYGSAIEVRKEPGRKAPVLLELMRVGDIEAPGDDPAAQAPAKKKAGRKKAAE